MLRESYIQFPPQEDGGSPTPNEEVILTKIGTQNLPDSSIKTRLDANSRLNTTFLLPGLYHVSFITVGFEDLNLLNHEHVNVHDRDHVEQIRDFSYYTYLQATDLDTFDHDLGNTNYSVVVESLDQFSRGTRLEGIAIEKLDNQVFIKTALTKGYTKYRVFIFNQANQLS